MPGRGEHSLSEAGAASGRAGDLDGTGGWWPACRQEGAGQREQSPEPAPAGENTVSRGHPEAGSGADGRPWGWRVGSQVWSPEWRRTDEGWTGLRGRSVGSVSERASLPSVPEASARCPGSCAVLPHLPPRLAFLSACVSLNQIATSSGRAVPQSRLTARRWRSAPGGLG